MTKIFQILAVLIVGFTGGVIAPMVLGWLKSVTVTAPDAISIANTYIVFTTLIFVGFTVVLGIAGYVFTQQFSAAKKAQEDQIIDDLRSRIGGDEKLAINLLDTILENPDAKTYFMSLLENKVDELITERVSDSQAVAAEAANEAAAIGKLATQLKKNGKGE
jgi:hypothetical protein